MLAAAGCFFGSLTIDAVSNLARVWTWLGVCAVLAVVGAGLLKKRKTSEEARREQEKRKAFEKEKAELESEIEQARQQLDLAERAIGSFDPQHTKGEKKLRALTVERERLLKEHGYDGIVDVQVMEAEKSERESFVHQFAQDNHLPGHRAVAALRWEPDDGPDERFHDAVGALMTLSCAQDEELPCRFPAAAEASTTTEGWPALARPPTIDEEDVVRLAMVRSVIVGGGGGGPLWRQSPSTATSRGGCVCVFA